MSDPNDPFAAQPYVPPSQRGNDTDTQDAPPEAPDAGPPAQEPVADQQEPPPETAPPEPEPEPVDSATEDTVQVEQPASPDTSSTSTHEMPAVADRPQQDAADDGEDDRESTVMLPVDSQDDDGTTPPPRSRRRLAGTLALVVLAAGAGVGGVAAYDAIRGDDGGSVVSSLDAGSDTGSAPGGAIERVAEKVQPSVVQITIAGENGMRGGASGVIISSDGEILTNDHVVEPVAEDGTLRVTFLDGTRAEAEILGRDPLTDLAVIKAEPQNDLTPAVLGKSADLRVGQQVVAIGSPLGLESTVTSGIIGALDRPISLTNDSNEEGTHYPAIQTDAAINQGNSGGALVDIEGRVVGIPNLLQTNTGGSVGLGFAIPIDLAKHVAGQLADGKKAEHSRIGVTVRAAVAEDTTRVGAEIAEVTKGSAGDDANLAKGDVVTAVNNRLVDGPDALVASIRGYQPGETITITYTRDGDEKTTKVKLESDGGKLGS